MAKLDEYWNQIKQSESFQDLDDGQKEKVRSKLFDKYVQTSSSYLDLPQSQRIKVKDHFDEVTKIEPETLMGGIKRKAKPIIKAARKIPGAIESGVQAAAAGEEKIGQKFEEIKGKMDPYDVSNIEALGEGTPIPGAKKLSESFAQAGEAAGAAIDPNFVKPSLTAFDTARAIGAGAVRTVGDFLSGIVPETTSGAALYLTDPVFKYAGTTFLGKELHMPGWKPQSGLSAEATGIGSDFEKIITKRRIENNARMNTEGGAPKPLEVLAKKEMELQAQDEFETYQKWLQDVDKLSPSGGEPQGDLYPPAKTNVSQLRDAAKARLEKLKNEPVRVESLGSAEDELRGYFRRTLDRFPRPGSVIELPETSVPRGTQAQIPGPEERLLLGPGKTPKEPAGPAAAVSPPQPAAPVESFGETGIKGYKQFIAKAFQNRLPEQSKQAIDNLSGALLGSLKDQGYIHPTNPKPLNVDMMNFLDQLVDQATKVIEPQEVKKAPSSRITDEARLRDKGIEPAEVRAEAARLQSQHQASTGISDFEKAIQAEGGLAMDPKMQGEHLRNVPIHLRGNVMPDDMAQRLFEHNLQEDASASTMYRKLSERKKAGRPRTQRSFMDEAERNIEHQKQVEAGFAEDLSLRGEKAPEAGPVQGAGGTQQNIPGTESQFPDRKIRDLQNESTFNVVKDLFNGLGEKGQIGGEIDPVRQAAVEAAVKELVDRAMALGYQTTQDIMLYAAKNAPKDIQAAIRKNLAPTLSPFDPHAYKEVEEARKGNPIAKKSLMDRAMVEYFKDKQEWVKRKFKAIDASRQILIFKDADESTMRLKNDLFIHDTYRGHSKSELAAQRWYNEGAAPKQESLMRLGYTEEEAKAMLDLYQHPSERMKAAKGPTQFHEDSWHKLFSEFYDDLGYRENHVTRRWKQPEQYLNWEGQVLQNRPNFMKGAKLISQAQGIDAGLDPVSLDIRDDLKAANEQRIQILSRVHALNKMALTLDAKGRGGIIDESEPGSQSRRANITPHTGEAPPEYLRYKDVPMLRGLAINPEYKPALDYMLSKRFKGWGVDWIEWLAGTSKGMRLSLSGFHPLSLTEMLLTGASYRDLFSLNSNRNLIFKTMRTISDGAKASLDNPLNWKNPMTKEGRVHNAGEISRLYDSFMKGSAVLANRPLALDMAEHGFRFGGMEEDISNRISQNVSRYENWLNQRIKNAGRPQDVKAYREALETAKGVREANDVFQKGLWSYMHQAFSMSIYENQVADNIMKFNIRAPEGQKIPIDKIKSDTANFVHKEMGGISYGRLLITPRMQQILQWSLLAPSWTIGRVLMGAAIFEKGPEGRQARKQALRMAIAYGVTGNVANYVRTKVAFGKGRFMWDNPEDQKLNIFWKLTPKKEELYVQGSKASTEVWDDLNHPMRTMARKASGPVQAAAKIYDWSTASQKTPYMENPLQATAGMFIPGSISGMSAYSMLPVRKGVTPASIARLFDKFYETGQEKYRDEAIRFASEAGINWESINRSAKGRATSMRHKKEREALFQ